jgi:hypothetical protein
MLLCALQAKWYSPSVSSAATLEKLDLFADMRNTREKWTSMMALHEDAASEQRTFRGAVRGGIWRWQIY